MNNKVDKRRGQKRSIKGGSSAAVPVSSDEQGWVDYRSNGVLYRQYDDGRVVAFYRITFNDRPANTSTTGNFG